MNNMEVQKFKVGDKVFNPKYFYLWNNNFHHNQFLASMILTVRFANERFFSTGCSNLDHTAGMDAWEVNHQLTGEPKSGDRKLLHLVHDQAEIMEFIHKHTSEAYKEAQHNKEQAIKEAEQAVKVAMENLEWLKKEKETAEQIFLRKCHNDIIVKLQNS